MSELAGNRSPRNAVHTAEPVDIHHVGDTAGDGRLTKGGFTTGEIETEIHVDRDVVEALESFWLSTGHRPPSTGVDQ